MLSLILTAPGVILVIIEILIQEFNEGSHSNIASWIAGCYLTLGIAQCSRTWYLVGVLSALPTIVILITKMIRRMSHE